MDTPITWDLEAARPIRGHFAWEPLPALRSAVAANDAEIADCRGKRIGILIVAYNAVATLAGVLHRITPSVWSNVEEIAVFDDASQDATYDLAVGMKTLWALPKLHALKHRRNLGYGGNQKAGFRHFIDKGFDVVILLHGDGQYAPEILAQLYQPIISGYADAVFGSRMLGAYGGALRGGMPLYKYVGNRILSAIENRALGMHLSEFHSGYRAYSLDALRHVDLSRMSDDFHFDTEIIIKLHHQRYSIREIPIPTYYGSEICHVNGLRYARNVVRAVRHYLETSRSVARHPEFQEYLSHYPLKLTASSSHDCARRMAGTRNEVLDVGCGNGYFAAELTKHANRVTGIDRLSLPESLDAFTQYVQGDLEAGLTPVAPQLRARSFDRILLLDVLEHLQEPGRVLSECCPLLKPGGAVVVSLPNVANIAIRLQLLFGRFEYTERGILDRTHLRFFTHKTARRFLRENGYRILEEKATVIPIDLAFGLVSEGRLHRILSRALLWLTRMLPRLFAYQFVFLAKPDDCCG